MGGHPGARGLVVVRGWVMVLRSRQASTVISDYGLRCWVKLEDRVVQLSYWLSGLWFLTRPVGWLLLNGCGLRTGIWDPPLSVWSGIAS